MRSLPQVNLTSPTTTAADKYIVPLLARFCNEADVNRLAQQLFRAKTAWFVTLSPFEVVRADQKNFTCADVRWGWATVEVNEPEKLLAQCGQLLLELRLLKQEKALQLVFLSVVNLSLRRSDVILCGPDEVSMAKAAFPAGKFFCPAGMEETQELQLLGVPLQSCALDVGELTSRKKEFKPAIDAALVGGWRPSVPAIPQAGAAGDGPSKLMLFVDTRVNEGQVLERTFTVSPK